MEFVTFRKSVKIIFIYIVSALIWTFFSDNLFNRVFNYELNTNIKMFIFVFLTALLLYYIIYSSFRIIGKNNALLKNEKENFRILLENTNIGIIVFDQNGSRNYYNNKFFDIMGYTKNEIEKIEDIKKFFKNELEYKVLFSNEEYSEIVDLKLDNEKLVEITRRNIHENKIIIIVEDITKNKNLEKSLRVSEEKYRRIIEAAEEGIWIIDEEGKTVFHNKKISSILYCDAQELTDSTIFNFIRNEDIPTVKNYIKLFVNSGKWKTDVLFSNKKGDLIWTMVSAVNLFNEENNSNDILLMVTDINTRKKAEESIIKAKVLAEDASKAKSQFLANMSHEMRTPLNGIIGMEYLLSNTNIDEKQTEYLNMLRDSADNLLHLINDVLDLARLESKKIEFNEISFDIKNLITDTIKLLRSSADRKNITFDVKIDDKINYSILSDPKYLQQVLKNLISNSVKFSHENSTVNIYVEEVEKDYLAYIKISVQDKGVGIQREKIEKLFDTFYQIDEPDRKRVGGTGLGLAISKKIVDYMSGKIEVWSEVEKGSIFSIEIPFKFMEDKVMESVRPIKIEKDNLSGKKVMIVEDNEINIALIENLLIRRNMQVEVSVNGEEAVEKHNNKDFDIILMDIQMPKMNGYQATAKIREKEKNKEKKTKIIALTAYAMEEDKDKCIAAGMDDYISKPFKAEDLYNVMLKYL